MSIMRTWIRDLKDKDLVRETYLVKYAAIQLGKNGKPYMNVILMDRTGEIEARLWDEVDAYETIILRDNVVSVEGKCQMFQSRKQLVIHSAQFIREEAVDWSAFLPSSVMNTLELEKKLSAWMHSVEDPDYRRLALAIIQNPDVQERLRVAPAAKSQHHAYRGGLMEHIVSILGLSDMIAKHYGSMVNRDLLMLGGLLHDIGKIWELSFKKTIEYTTLGRLIGHHILGVELIERTCQELGSFPEEKKTLLKHLIIAHHGKLEYGSPKVPHFLEAELVHRIDDLDSKVNAIWKFIEQDSNMSEWTSVHRTFERAFFKGVPKPGHEPPCGVDGHL